MKLSNDDLAECYICSLEEIDSDSIPLVGGKGANLGELTKAKLPVPQAVCVTTLAYEQFIKANSLLAPILGVLKGLDYDDAPEIEHFGSKLDRETNDRCGAARVDPHRPVLPVDLRA